MTTRADFRALVDEVAKRTNRPRFVVTLLLADRVEQNASRSANPARIAHLDQIAAAMRAEAGSAFDRDLKGHQRWQ